MEDALLQHLNCRWTQQHAGKYTFITVGEKTNKANVQIQKELSAVENDKNGTLFCTEQLNVQP